MVWFPCAKDEMRGGRDGRVQNRRTDRYGYSRSNPYSMIFFRSVLRVMPRISAVLVLW